MRETELYARGRAAADAILRECYGIDIRKALNPLDREDFVTIAIRLARAFEKAAKPERDALDRAVKNLDRDWPGMSQRQRNQVVDASARIIRDSSKRVLPGVVGVAEVESPRLVSETRKATKRKFGLNILTSTNAFDKRVIDFNVKSQGNFVTSEFGSRSDVFSRQARQIVSGGLARGEGRDQIAERLNKKLTANGIARAESYWRVAAGVFVNRSRTFGQLSAYDDAGIVNYIFESVLDEATSDVCRMMHGRIFTVRSGVEMFDRIEQLSDPIDIKNVQPFARTRNAEDGGLEIRTSPPGGEPVRLARIVESGVGRRDATGRFSNTLSDVELQAAGVTMPPLHGGCRSIVVPDI